MKNGIYFSLGLFSIGVFLTILQIWFELFSGDIFLKLISTIVIILVLSVIVILILKDYFEEKKLKEDNFIR